MYFFIRLAALLDVIIPSQAENTSSERVASSSSSSTTHIQHTILHVC